MICSKCRMAGVTTGACATPAQARLVHNIPAPPKVVLVPARKPAKPLGA